MMVVPLVPPLFIPMPNPPRREEPKRTYPADGRVHLYSTNRGVREIVATYNLGTPQP